FDPVQFKNIAINSFKSTFGNKYVYTIKAPVVNLKNKTEDIDIAFFNILSQSTMLCSTANRCSELNYGKDSATASWYKSERLSLYSKLDEVFSVNTDKRKLINRAGKIFKVWRSKTFSTQTVKVPSIALVTIMYDFKKDKNNPDNYSSSIEMLRDMTYYGVVKYFKDKSCSGASSAEINLPVYQQDRNLLNRLNSAQRIDFCKNLVKFNEALEYSASEKVSEAESVKTLEPFIGSL
ncbi:hypothetical protein A3S85_24185, partial [Salmonella enterica subsp. enterica serovar Enteritidis]|nr:hypothetical protein [Salmonella enterica subsp. enterica serovar Enteritidis]